MEVACLEVGFVLGLSSLLPSSGGATSGTGISTGGTEPTDPHTKPPGQMIRGPIFPLESVVVAVVLAVTDAY